MTKPTDAAIREYLTGYYQQSEDYTSFNILSIGASTELNAREAQVHVTYDSDGSVIDETIYWTLWIEDGAVYGEY